METLVVLFWANVLCGLAQAVTLVIGLRSRPINWIFALGCGTLILSMVTGSLLWLIEGRCLLPHPGLVEFHQGMTLCPGQSARLPPIEIIVPNRGRDL